MSNRGFYGNNNNRGSYGSQSYGSQYYSEQTTTNPTPTPQQPSKCTACGGTGTLWFVQPFGDEKSESCSYCHGSGTH